MTRSYLYDEVLCISNHRITKTSTSQSLSQLNSFDQTSEKQVKWHHTWDVQMSSCEKQSLVTPGNLAGIGTSAIATTAPAVPSPGQQQGQVIKSFAMSRLRTISLCHGVGHFSRAFRNQTATLLSFTTRSSKIIVRLLLHITYAYKQCKILSYNPTGCFLMLLHFLTRFRSLDKNAGCFAEGSKSQSWESCKSPLEFLC